MPKGITLDGGGTLTRVALASRDPGTLAAVQHFATPRDPEEAMRQIAVATQELAQGMPSILIGGICGVIRSNGTLSAPPHLPEWEGFNIRERLGAHLPGVRIRFFNDNVLATWGEALLGAGKPYAVVAQMRVGTGVGGACVPRGKKEPPITGFEPGHHIIGPGYATLESHVGGAMIHERYNRHPKFLPRRVYDSLTPFLARGVWNAIVHWRPDVIVLGGGVMNEANGFRVGEVRAELEKIHARVRVIPELPPLVAGTLGDDAGLKGATLLFDIVR